MDIIYFYIYHGVYFSDNMFLIFRRCVSITYVFYWDIIGSMANNYTLMSGFAQKLVYYKTNHNGDVVGIHRIFSSGYHGYAMGRNPRIYCRFRMRKATVNSTGRNGIPYFGQPHVGQGWSQKDLSWEIVEPVGNENEMKGHQKTTMYINKHLDLYLCVRAGPCICRSQTVRAV